MTQIMSKRAPTTLILQKLGFFPGGKGRWGAGGGVKGKKNLDFLQAFKFFSKKKKWERRICVSLQAIMTAKWKFEGLKRKRKIKRLEEKKK